VANLIVAARALPPTTRRPKLTAAFWRSQLYLGLPSGVELRNEPIGIDLGLMPSGKRPKGFVANFPVLRNTPTPASRPINVDGNSGREGVKFGHVATMSLKQERRYGKIRLL
jgi:hypothetical protein